MTHGRLVQVIVMTAAIAALATTSAHAFVSARGEVVSARGRTVVPARGGTVAADCSGVATLGERVVANPQTSAGADVATWDVVVPKCAGVLVYQIIDADTGKPVEREAVFAPHTVRRERWEKIDGGLRLHLHLENVADATGDTHAARKLERATRRLRAVVHWFPSSRRA